MAKTKYKEVQQFKRWDVIALMSGIGALLIYGLSTKLKGSPTVQMDPVSLIVAIVSILGIFISVVYLINVRLYTKITDKAIHFQYYPIHYRSKKIPIDDIVEVSLQTLPANAQLSGWGVQYNSLRRSYSVSSQSGLIIKTRRGKELFVGTEHPEDVKYCIDRLMNEK